MNQGFVNTKEKSPSKEHEEKYPCTESTSNIGKEKAENILQRSQEDKLQGTEKQGRRIYVIGITREL